MIYWFTGASMQAVSTGAYRAVEFIKQNIKLDASAAKASVEDSKKVVEICTQYAQKGMFNIFLVVFFSTLAFACFEPFFFIGYLISIALFGLYQAIFMANAGGAWDNAKKIVEVELKEKGTPLHAATVVGDTVGDPFKDTSSVAMNPVIKFTTLFGLLAVELAVEMTARRPARPDADPVGGVPRDLDVLRLPLVLRHAHRRPGALSRRAGPCRTRERGLSFPALFLCAEPSRRAFVWPEARRETPRLAETPGVRAPQGCALQPGVSAGGVFRRASGPDEGATAQSEAAAVLLVRRARQNSITAGSTEMTMMARITSEKFSCTNGRLPKK